MIRFFTRVFLASVLALCLVPTAFAQDDDDAVLKPAEPDFTLVNLPTALRLPVYRSAFRVTHRFDGPLKNSGFADLFGLDEGAQIGLEYRFGIVKNGQVGFYRISDKTIDLFANYGVVRQGASSPVELAATFSIEGTNNFKDSYSPSLAAVISRRFGDVAAFYVEPTWVNNTNSLPKALVDHNDTVTIGVGARVYLVAEIVPRVSGYKPGTNHASFAIEKRAGGHMFQLNASNGGAALPGSLARGAFSNDNWYLGFNLGRKFY